MKNKLSRQQQNQRANLIFKYVKTLGPYSTTAEKQLYNKQHSSRTSNKQPSLQLNSKVYQMNLSSNKGKKRVTFVQNEENQFNDKLAKSKQKSTLHSQKQRTYASTQRTRINQNPQQICRDLISLQRSIYSAFNIKDYKATQSSESTFFSKIPLTQSNYQGKFMQLQLESKIKSNTEKEQLSQFQISKCQSQRTIYRNNRLEMSENTNRKEIIRSMQKEPILIQSNLKQNSYKRTKQDMKNSQESFSGVSRMDKKSIQQMQSSSRLSSSRSNAYWKQQNDLMIQIFRKKLENKFNLSPSKYN